MTTDEQLKTDLLVLHGFLSNRDGFHPCHSKAVAKALKILFPDDTLSTMVEKDLDSLSKS